MKRAAELQSLCREYGLLGIYLFGSRADDGLQLLDGAAVPAQGSDLDIGLVFLRHDFPVGHLADLQVRFEDLFAPLRIDLVPLQRVDALFQFRAIDGHRIATSDSTRNDLWELTVMRRAAELLPIQRRLELERFGVSTS